jgi:NAD(P)-dependent dehydrogenase (short-subunit alcohol dehydrogenase family)
MNVLADKVASVTGASSGVGRATALLFALEGDPFFTSQPTRRVSSQVRRCWSMVAYP